MGVLDRWLSPSRIAMPASAFPAYSAFRGDFAVPYAGNAENADAAAPIRRRDADAVGALVNGDQRGACEHCGEPITDADTETAIPIGDGAGGIRGYIHGTDACYDGWFFASFGRHPTPKRLP